MKKKGSSRSVIKGGITPLDHSKKNFHLDINQIPSISLNPPASPARSAHPGFNKQISYSELMEKKNIKRMKTQKKDKYSSQKLKEAIFIL